MPKDCKHGFITERWNIKRLMEEGKVIKRLFCAECGEFVEFEVHPEDLIRKPEIT